MCTHTQEKAFFQLKSRRRSCKKQKILSKLKFVAKICCSTKVRFWTLKQQQFCIDLDARNVFDHLKGSNKSKQIKMFCKRVKKFDHNK